MLNTDKVQEFFDASKLDAQLNVVGCGAVGSHVAEQLARMGCRNIHLWDFDKVEPHNISNQMFKQSDIGRPKVEAVRDMMIEINDDLKDKITIHPDGLKAPWIVNGYIFMCADSMVVRKAIVAANKVNPNAIAAFDFRMRLTDAQHYAADLRRPSMVKDFERTMNFTDEEALAATPMSACGTSLSVVFTVKAIASLGVANFVNFTLGQELHYTILIDMKEMILNAFK